MTRPDNFSVKGDKNPLGIYIHIPFCASKCPYCNFYSVNETKKADEYVFALINDITTLEGMREFVSPSQKKLKASTVYFGGGTPSLLGGERISAILNAVKSSFELAEDAEITLECNPSTPDIEKLFTQIKSVGVNRISLGMQSAVDSERRILGRKAEKKRVQYCVESAKASGIDNISLDIMLGIPKQSIDSLTESLDFALSLGVPHISAYILKLEEGTFFYKNQSRLSLPSEDLTADMYLHMCSYLEAAGMRHYEISNFCFDDKYGIHNMNYWRCGEYLGFGAAAHSYYNKKRFFYPPSLDDYIKGKKALYDCEGGDLEEKFMLSLRTDIGTDTEKLFNDFEIKPKDGFYREIELLKAHSLLNYSNGILTLTDSGMLISNSIISSLLCKI